MMNIDVYNCFGESGGYTVFSLGDLWESFKWTDEALGQCWECRHAYIDLDVPPCCDCAGLGRSEHNYFEEYDW